MKKHEYQYCATDKEIFDVLMASKQKLGPSALREIAKDRRVFYSPQETRETLVGYLSLLPHDYAGLDRLLHHRESFIRQDKTTFLTLSATLEESTVREVIRESATESSADESITQYVNSDKAIVARVDYSEIDYSKNRLIQRTPREALIEFHVAEGKTTIRLPANDRAKSIVDKIRDKLGTRLGSAIQIERIEVSDFDSAELRTEFFTRLIRDISGFSLQNVMSVKVDRLFSAPPELSEDDEDSTESDELSDENKVADAKAEALASVRKVSLRGEDLLSTEEFDNLKRKGFYITSLVWRSKLHEMPHHLIEFESAFDDPEAGTGFKYFVRGAYNATRTGGHTKTMRPVELKDRVKYTNALEHAAREAVQRLRLKSDDERATTDGAT